MLMLCILLNIHREHEHGHAIQHIAGVFERSNKQTKLILKANADKAHNKIKSHRMNPKRSFGK